MGAQILSINIYSHFKLTWWQSYIIYLIFSTEIQKLITKKARAMPKYTFNALKGTLAILTNLTKYVNLSLSAKRVSVLHATCIIYETANTSTYIKIPYLRTNKWPEEIYYFTKEHRSWDTQINSQISESQILKFVSCAN